MKPLAGARRRFTNFVVADFKRWLVDDIFICRTRFTRKSAHIRRRSATVFNKGRRSSCRLRIVLTNKHSLSAARVMLACRYYGQTRTRNYFIDATVRGHAHWSEREAALA